MLRAYSKLSPFFQPGVTHEGQCLSLRTRAPMIEHKPFHELPIEDLGWLRARRHLARAAPDHPSRSGWGALRVWSDHEIASNAGFPLHAHGNIEIITYVREGAITHRDSLGNEGRIEAGQVQVVS